MNRIIVRRERPLIVAPFRPKKDGDAGAKGASWPALPRPWVDAVEGVDAGPVEKTAGSRTSATPQSTPRARRRMIRELVTARPSFWILSLLLSHE